MKSIHTFCCKTEICFGQDALGRLEQLSAARVLVVTDPFFAQNGLAKRVGSRVPGAELAFFDEVQPDPDLELVAKGLKQMHTFGPDAVITLGGGSAIDCAKAMVYFYESPVTFVAIPTTSGTGSEVTSFSILTHEGVKHPLIDAKLLPQIAILDDTLLAEMPKTLIADAGMDVLAHCLEAVCAKNCSPFATALATEAFARVFAQLGPSYRGQTQVREDIHIAATMAGLAFDHAGLGVCHALAHALGGAFHTPHGRLNGILLPAVMEFNAHACALAYRQLAARCGLLGATNAMTVKALTRGLIQLRRELEMPRTLREAGVAPDEVKRRLSDLAETALQDPCCATNPRPATVKELEQLILSVAM